MLVTIFHFQISEDIEGSIVYLDAGSTESFQFIGAYPVLLDLGARAICSLENMSALDAVSSSFTCCPRCLSVLTVSYQKLIMISLKGYIFLLKM